MTPTTFLRPVHAWFFYWERVIPSLYRVVATGLGACITTLVLAAAGLRIVISIGVSVPTWVALAIAQEHDERIVLPPDERFLSALTAAVARPPLLLTVEHALGPKRARHNGSDLYELSAAAALRHPLAGMRISIARSAADQSMRVDADGGPDDFIPVDERLRQRGKTLLADRICAAQSPHDDAEAVADALEAAFW